MGSPSPEPPGCQGPLLTAPAPWELRTPQPDSALAKALTASAHSTPHTLLAELQDIVWCIPSKEDFEAFSSCIEKFFRKDIDVLQQSTVHLTPLVDNLEATSSATELWMHAMNSKLQGTILHLAHLQLQIKVPEILKRKNIVHIRGLQETSPPVHLHDTVLSIFSRLLDDTAAGDIKVDRVHRAID